MSEQSTIGFVFSLIGTIIVTAVVTFTVIIVSWLGIGWLMDHAPWIGIPLFFLFGGGFLMLSVAKAGKKRSND